MTEIVLFECKPMRARISQGQCKANRDRGALACSGCKGLSGEGQQVGYQPAPPPSVPLPRPTQEGADELVLHFTGEDAEILRQFKRQAKDNGLTLEENVATVIHLVITGQAKIP